MAITFFGFFAKNKPVQRFRKTNNIPGANWLITREEIGHGIKHLKNSKATGPDNISAELLKAGGEAIATSLQRLFNLILTSKRPPSESVNYIIVVPNSRG